jgi:hypothetical protein
MIENQFVKLRKKNLIPKDAVLSYAKGIKAI